MKNHLSRILLAAGALAFALLPAIAARVSAGQPRIGVLIYKYDDTYISTVRNALTKAFEGKASISMQDGKGDQATQNDQLDVMIEKSTDGLLVNMVDAQAAAGVLAKIQEANIPVVFFNREPDLKVLKTYPKALFVGTNAADAGKMQGDIILNLWTSHPEYDLNKDGKFQYVMFKGEPDNPEAIARTEWSVRQAGENGVPMDQIGQTFVCNWDTAQAQGAMESALAANEGKIELVIANNDSMAMGAIAALSNVGYNVEGGTKFTPVVGVDATEQAIDAINKGIMSATVKQDGEAMGQAVSAIILNLVAGRPPLDGTGYTFDGSGIAVRIPYSPYERTK
ncbi:MAG: galactose ABC transporter substrate-binding protein [Planctomycetota bacterium]|jgi:methyl-galactoside transport system substrate-binding protein|nr:galactose ABC transporter substrate-binding protein [Planctomycetota bacterium]